MIQALPVVHQYSIFDEVKDVVKVGKISDVDNLPPGEINKQEKKGEKKTSMCCFK